MLWSTRVASKYLSRWAVRPPSYHYFGPRWQANAEDYLRVQTFRFSRVGDWEIEARVRPIPPFCTKGCDVRRCKTESHLHDPQSDQILVVAWCDHVPAALLQLNPTSIPDFPYDDCLRHAEHLLRDHP